MASLLLGITLVLWSLNLLAIAAIDNTLLGVLALITGVLYVISSLSVGLPNLPVRKVDSN